jgi:cobalamin-dependent methionine synthase I
MFCMVGERINTTRKRVQQAVADRDAAYIQQDVQAQQRCGAQYIDINAGARIGHETEDMQWLLEVVQPVVTVPLCLDSPDPKVLAMAYERVQKPPMINSISLEKARFDAMAPFLEGKKCKIVALCLDDSGLPKTALQIVQRAETIVMRLAGLGFSRDSVYVDPLVQPVSTDTKNGAMVLEAVSEIRKALAGVHIICGLSNISYGLPKRKIINRTFLSLMMAAGLDAAILDPLDADLTAVLKTTQMLLGQDIYCAKYLKAFRAGEIPG